MERPRTPVLRDLGAVAQRQPGVGLQFQLMEIWPIESYPVGRKITQREGAGKPEPGDSCGQSRPAGARQEASWLWHPGCLPRLSRGVGERASGCLDPEPPPEFTSLSSFWFRANQVNLWAPRSFSWRPACWTGECR